MKRSCGNCYWFNHRYDVAGASFSCRELATVETDAPCGDFSRDGSVDDNEIVFDTIASDFKANDKEYSDPAQRFFDVSQTEDILNIVTEIFKMEQGAATVVQKVKDEIERQGFQLPFNSSKLENFVTKLSDLYLLYRMTLSWGMGGYMDEIMKQRIAFHFADPRQFNKNPVFKDLSKKEADTE